MFLMHTPGFNVIVPSMFILGIVKHLLNSDGIKVFIIGLSEELQ